MAEVRAEVAANVWKVVATEGSTLEVGYCIVILGSQEDQIVVEATEPGTVTSVAVAAGDTVQVGDLIAVVD